LSVSYACKQEIEAEAEMNQAVKDVIIIVNRELAIMIKQEVMILRLLKEYDS
jgi:hypothetical protein